MKKIKLLTNFAIVSTIAGSMSAIASCACTSQIKPELIDSSEGVKIKESNIVKGKDSTITLEIPEGKEIKSVSIKIGNKVLSDDEYTINGNIIKIKAKAVDGENVAVSVIVKDIVTLTSVSTNPTSLTKQVGEQITTGDVVVTLNYSDGSKKANAVWNTDYKVFTTIDDKEQEIVLPYTFKEEEEGTINCKVKAIEDPTKYASLTITVNPAKTDETVIVDSDGKTYVADMTTICLENPTEEIDIKGTALDGTEKTWKRSDFNEKIEIGKNYEELASEKKAYFLAGCTSFNQTIEFPAGITEIGSAFLMGCTKFNNGVQEGETETKPLIIPKSVTSFGSGGLLYGCTSFNQPVTFEEGSEIQTIEWGFLRSCESFNQTVTLPSSVTEIGSEFMVGCSKFNNRVNLPTGLQKIGDCFMNNCQLFDRVIPIPSNVKSIGNSFLSYCATFNKTVTLPDGIETIGGEFLSNCISFNLPITIPSSVTTIGENFLSSEGKEETPMTFNSTITFAQGSNLVKLGNGMLKQCASFANVIDFSSINQTNLTIEGTEMLGGVSDTNTVTFKVATGTESDWTTKLNTATSRTIGTSPNVWVIQAA